MKLTGLTKQDYIIRRLLERDVVVQGNPRVYKALRDQLAAVLDELRRIEAGQSVNDGAAGRFIRIDRHHYERNAGGFSPMINEKKKMTAQGSSVGADDGQSISKTYENSIPTSGEEINDEIVNSPESLEEVYRRMQRMADPRYLRDYAYRRDGAVPDRLYEQATGGGRTALRRGIYPCRSA